MNYEFIANIVICDFTQFGRANQIDNLKKKIVMMGVERDSESVPVFVPPRKRQTTKKVNGVQNYVDHIVSVQVSKCNAIFIHSFEYSLSFNCVRVFSATKSAISVVI